MKHVHDMIITHSRMHRTCKYSQHSSIIWLVWPNGWVFVSKLSGCWFESSCSCLNFRFRASFEQDVSCLSSNNRVWIYSETRTWHDKKSLSNGTVHTSFRNTAHLASLTEWLSIRLQTKCLWVGAQLQSLKLQISHLLWARNSFDCSVWLNGWMFVYELSGCGFKSTWSNLSFRFRACLEQGFLLHSCNYGLRIHYKMRMWHDKNAQWKAPYR